MSEAENRMNPKKRKIFIAAISAAVLIAVVLSVIFLIIPAINNNSKSLNVSDIIKKADIGDTVSFGSYEQNNNKNDGKESIEWIILAKENDKALITSRYVLDCQMYNEEDVYVPWEECTLRTWLNSEFLNTAFSEDEKTQIYSAKDKVFILSSEEADKYFTDNEARKCAPTEYAKYRRVRTRTESRTEEGKLTCCYWLDGKGYHDDFAVITDYEGTIYERGLYVDETTGIRPALWISVKE